MECRSVYAFSTALILRGAVAPRIYHFVMVVKFALPAGARLRRSRRALSICGRKIGRPRSPTGAASLWEARTAGSSLDLPERATPAAGLQHFDGSNLRRPVVTLRYGLSVPNASHIAARSEALHVRAQDPLSYEPSPFLDAPGVRPCRHLRMASNGRASQSYRR